MEVLKNLLSTNTATGHVEWIGFSSASRAVIETPQEIRIVTGGIAGDHNCRPQRASKRQVTLIQAEHIAVVEAMLGGKNIAPSSLRRNFVVSGINLAALKHQRFRIGTAVLEGSGDCPPCSRMEENLGPGGYAAMLSHGGITAIVLSEGIVCLGDTVTAIISTEISTDSSAS